jgi:hypothetical protein
VSVAGWHVHGCNVFEFLGGLLLGFTAAAHTGGGPVWIGEGFLVWFVSMKLCLCTNIGAAACASAPGSWMRRCRCCCPLSRETCLDR